MRNKDQSNHNDYPKERKAKTTMRGEGGLWLRVGRTELHHLAVSLFW